MSEDLNQVIKQVRAEIKSYQSSSQQIYVELQNAFLLYLLVYIFELSQSPVNDSVLSFEGRKVL